MGGTGELRHGNRIVIDREIVRITSLSEPDYFYVSISEPNFSSFCRKDTCACARDRKWRKLFGGLNLNEFEIDRFCFNYLCARACYQFRFKMDWEVKV